MSQTLPKQNPDIGARSFEGVYILVDPRHGVLHELNGVAGLIWQLCDGKRTIQEIASQISQKYVVSEQEALKDVSDFLDELRQKGLVC